jgi:formylglycine-generating enzyme required for sulfatase activity
MIDVPGGSIVLGDLKLRVDSFMISKYETTQAEYFAVMNSNPSKLPSRNDPSTFNNYPVNQVNWFDAIEYCNRRSIKENLTRVIDFLFTEITQIIGQPTE